MFQLIYSAEYSFLLVIMAILLNLIGFYFYTRVYSSKLFLLLYIAFTLLQLDFQFNKIMLFLDFIMDIFLHWI